MDSEDRPWPRLHLQQCRHRPVVVCGAWYGHSLCQPDDPEARLQQVVLNESIVGTRCRSIRTSTDRGVAKAATHIQPLSHGPIINARDRPSGGARLPGAGGQCRYMAVQLGGACCLSYSASYHGPVVAVESIYSRGKSRVVGWKLVEAVGVRNHRAQSLVMQASLPERDADIRCPF